MPKVLLFLLFSQVCLGQISKENVVSFLDSGMDISILQAQVQHHGVTFSINKETLAFFEEHGYSESLIRQILAGDEEDHEGVLNELLKPKPHSGYFYVESDSFKMYTEVEEDLTLQLAIELERFRIRCEALFPSLKLSYGIKPIIIITTSRESFDYLYSKKTHPQGFFLDGDIHPFIIVLAKEGRNPRSALFHEFTHWLQSKSMSRFPGWQIEGMAEFFGTMTIEEGHFSFGITTLAKYAHKLNESNSWEWVPLTTFLEVESGSVSLEQGIKPFYIQSFVWWHFFIASHQSRNNQWFQKLSDSTYKGMDQKDIFISIFGSLEKAEDVFEEYFRTNFGPTKEVPFKEKFLAESIKILEISENTFLRAQALALVNKRYFQKASEIIAKCDPEDPETILIRAFIKSNVEPEQAKEDWLFAHEKNGDSQLFSLLWLKNLSKGNREIHQINTKIHIERIKAIDSVNSNAILGRYYLKRRMNHQALQHYEKAYQLAPGDIGVNVTLIKLYWRTKQPKKAQLLFDQIKPFLKPKERASLSSLLAK